MIEDLMGAYGGRLAIAIIGVGIGLVCLIGILWILRGRGGPSPFVRGGRNRNPRLQVLDAAAVDTRRRLVLVRRDDVEHLIMIGGPTDIVVESGIVSGAGSRISTEAPPAAATQPAAEPRTQPTARTIAAPRDPRLDAPREPIREISRETVAREAPRSLLTPSQNPLPLQTPSSSQAPLPAAIPPRAEPVTAVRPAQPLPQAPVRAEVAPRAPAPEVTPEPALPTPTQTTAAPAVATPAVTLAAAAATPTVLALDDAANVLDAARSRVLQERPEPPRVVPVNAATLPAVLQPAADKPKVLGSDFEKILEEEMENNMASRDAAIIRQPARQTPARNPAAPPITGATTEPSLQDEVARIFGEMSANRDH